MDKITVDAKALQQVLQALIGPPHLIRELQATANKPYLSENPIDVLCAEYNAAVAANT